MKEIYKVQQAVDQILGGSNNLFQNNINFENCSTQEIKPVILDSLKTGLTCMANPLWGGSKRSNTDIFYLLALITNPAKSI